MKLLKEFFHDRDIDINGKAVTRKAIRGIILRGNKLLMIHSKKIGDFKFPGGGVEEDETYEETLRREVHEESGARLLNIKNEYGKVIEYRIPKEKEYDVFKMTSYYYTCEVGTTFDSPSLDIYEKDLGFNPVWINIDKAISNNKAIISSIKDGKTSWIARETFVLEKIREDLKNLELE